LTFLSERKKDLELNDKSVRIGKDPQSDILVKGFAVGKTSAVINKMPDGWYINYVGGLSKPRLNNKPIKKSIKLEKLDVISIGSTKLQFLIS
jgi:pSer/pThr/pTyr-binding forkhead associated (FHA) protein